MNIVLDQGSASQHGDWKQLLILSVMLCATTFAHAQRTMHSPSGAGPTTKSERSVESTASAKATGVVFNSNATINIPSFGNASLFPSVINVSGITPNAITKATVQLNGFYHSFPDDVDIVLEAPDGTRSIVMSDAGGSLGNGIPAPGINLSFSSTGANQVPDSATLSPAAPMRPGNYYDVLNVDGETDTFSGAGNPGALRFTPADFDAFVGINPNGAWKLYVTDDANGDEGNIAGGWTLVLTVPTIFTVTKTSDTNDGVCDADCSLREAIAAAAALTGNNEMIRFASPLFDSSQIITLSLGQLVATESVVIQGPGAAKLTISGNDASRILFVYPSAAVSLSGMTLTHGREEVSGGAIAVNGGQLYLRQMSLERNYSTGRGGAIAIAHGNANIVGSTFSDNSSDSFGGAIELSNIDPGPLFLRLVHSTISGNRAANGGAISVYNIAGSGVAVDLLSNTIVNNQAPINGGIEFSSDAVATTIRANLRNNIIANNSPSNFGVSQGSGSTISISSQGFNLTNDAVAAYYNIFIGDQLGADSKLGPLNNNGGQVETHALLHGSAALDAGQASGYARDVRGVDRAINSVGATAPNGDRSDIGAVEMNALIVSKIGDTNDGFCDFDCSLREAITQANVAPDQNDIVFSNNVFGLAPQTINLASALPDITTSLSINGRSAKMLTVRRDSGGAYRILHSPNGGRELAIGGITVSNGLGDGGGIVSESRTSLAEVSIEDNTDNGVFGGGGIQLASADCRIRNSSIINNNTIINGGGIFFQSTNHRLQLINTTLSGNQSSNGTGALYASGVGGGKGVVEINNSTLTNNTSAAIGSIVALSQTNAATEMSVKLRNTIVAGNTSPNLATYSVDGGVATIASQGFNLSNENSNLFLNQSTDKINTNPQLGPLADNGGPTRTHAPLTTSPAIDAGSFSGNRDQIGNARSNDVAGIANANGGDGSDIGAVELPILFRDGFD